MSAISHLSIDAPAVSTALHWMTVAVLGWLAVCLLWAALWVAPVLVRDAVARHRDRRFTRALDRARAAWEVEHHDLRRTPIDVHRAR
jgi:hypothetical protein